MPQNYRFVEENNIKVKTEEITNFEKFKRVSDIIIANRYDPSLEDVKEKVYTRDIYSRD